MQSVRHVLTMEMNIFPEMLFQPVTTQIWELLTGKKDSKRESEMLNWWWKRLC